jgi:hypothetical protein
MSFLLTGTKYYHPDIFKKEDLKNAIKETIDDYMLINFAVSGLAICKSTAG